MKKLSNTEAGWKNVLPIKKSVFEKVLNTTLPVCRSMKSIVASFAGQKKVTFEGYQTQYIKLLRLAIS